MIRFLVALSLVSCVATALAAEPPKKPAAKPKPASLFNGKDLTGWKIADNDALKHHGEVKVVKGEICLAVGKPSTGIVYAGEPPRNQYEISWEAKRTAGSDFFSGLTFPVDKEYATLILGGWGGGTTGISNIDGMAAVENDTTDYVEFKNNRWYKFRLRVRGRQITAWVDGEKIVDYDTTDQKLSIWWEQEHFAPSASQPGIQPRRYATYR